MEDQKTGELHNQDDVNPTSQLDKLVTDSEDIKDVKTDGTGGNHPVATTGTVNIQKEEDQ